MDATLAAIGKVGFPNAAVEFDTFYRVSPFPAEFLPYMGSTIEWTANYVSDAARVGLLEWAKSAALEPFNYFSETDLVCWLS
jgi:hypothetical protein